MIEKPLELLICDCFFICAVLLVVMKIEDSSCASVKRSRTFSQYSINNHQSSINSQQSSYRDNQGKGAAFAILALNLDITIKCSGHNFFGKIEPKARA